MILRGATSRAAGHVLVRLRTMMLQGRYTARWQTAELARGGLAGGGF